MEVAIGEALGEQRLSGRKVVELAQASVDETFNSFIFWSVVVSLVVTIIMLVVTFLVMAHPVNSALGPGAWKDNEYARVSALLMFVGVVIIILFGSWYFFYKRGEFAFEKALALGLKMMELPSSSGVALQLTG